MSWSSSRTSAAGYDGGHAGRLQRSQEGGGDGLVDLHAAHAEAINAAAVHQAAVGAVIAGSGARALVVHGKAPAAATASRQSLQQGGPFTDRPRARLVSLGANVGADAGLVGLVGGPVDVAGVMAHYQHLPVGAFQVTGPAAHVTVIIDAAGPAGAAVHISTSVGGVGEHSVDRG